MMKIGNSLPCKRTRASHHVISTFVNVDSDRDNANRMFDSQNNNRGGNNVGQVCHPSLTRSLRLLCACSP
jgi:hypothetical protein